MVNRVQLRGVPSAITGENLSLAQRLENFGGTAVKALQRAEIAEQKRQTEAFQAYQADVDISLREGLAQILAENPNNLQAFNEKSEALLSSTLSEVDEAYQAELAEKMLPLVSAHRQKVITNNASFIRQENKDKHTALIATANQDAQRLMREGEQTEASQAILDVKKSYDTLVENGHYTPSQADELYKKDIQKIAEQSYFADIESSKNEEQAIKKINDLKSSVPIGWSPDEWENLIAKAERKVLSQYAINRSQKKAEIKQLTNEVKTYLEAAEMGMDFPEDYLSRLQQRVYESGDQKTIDTLNLGVRAIDFGRLPAEKQEELIQKLEKSGPNKADEYIKFKNVYEKTQVEARKDGMGLAVSQNLVEANPMQTPDDYRRAGVDSMALSEYYRVPVSPFTDEVAANITSELPQMNSAEKYQLVQNINQMQPEARTAAYGQIMKKGGSMFAMVGAIGNPDLAKQAFRGFEKLQQGVVKAPSNIDYLTKYNSYVGDVYGAEDSRAVLDTALAVYADQYPSDEFSYNDFQGIVDQVTGGIGTYNGQKYQLPRGMAEGDFQDYIDLFSEQGFEMSGRALGYTYEQFMETLKDGNLKSIGDDEYIIIDSKTGGAILQENSEPFIFTYSPDYRGIKMPRIRSRR